MSLISEIQVHDDDSISFIISDNVVVCADALEADDYCLEYVGESILNVMAYEDIDSVELFNKYDECKG